MSFPREWNLKEDFKDGGKDSQMHPKNEKRQGGKRAFLFPRALFFFNNLSY